MNDHPDDKSLLFGSIRRACLLMDGDNPVMNERNVGGGEADSMDKGKKIWLCMWGCIY
jgi:hypothetical protein